MNADQFARDIAQYSMSYDYLIEVGVSISVANSLSKSFTLVRKTGCKSSYDDPLLDIVQCFDTTLFNVADVTFYSELSQSNGRYLLGKVESDLLTMDAETLQVSVYEWGSDRLFDVCAASGWQFLDALLIVAKFMQFRVQNENEELTDDPDLLESIATLCADAAGGTAYLNFFQAMIGCD